MAKVYVPGITLFYIGTQENFKPVTTIGNHYVSLKHCDRGTEVVTADGKKTIFVGINDKLIYDCGMIELMPAPTSLFQKFCDHLRIPRNTIKRGLPPKHAPHDVNVETVVDGVVLYSAPSNVEKIKAIYTTISDQETVSALMLHLRANDFANYDFNTYEELVIKYQDICEISWIRPETGERKTELRVFDAEHAIAFGDSEVIVEDNGSHLLRIEDVVLTISEAMRGGGFGKIHMGTIWYNAEKYKSATTAIVKLIREFDKVLLSIF